MTNPLTKDQMIQKIMTKVRQMNKAQLKKLLTKLNKTQRIEGMRDRFMRTEEMNVNPNLQKLNNLRNELRRLEKIRAGYQFASTQSEAQQLYNYDTNYIPNITTKINKLNKKIKSSKL
jgi:hypothetical protein